MMKREFNPLKIEVTEIGAVEKRELQAEQIKSFKDNELGQAVIIYIIRPQGEETEEITVQESSQKLAEMINGEPDDDAKAYMKREILRER